MMQAGRADSRGRSPRGPRAAAAGQSRWSHEADGSSLRTPSVASSFQAARKGARAWSCCAFGPLVELAVESRYAYWHRMEFQVAQWKALADHARDREMHFLSSPFSVEAVHLLASLGMPAWKVGSGEIRSRDLIRAVLDAGGPILLSTGMSPWSEIDDAVHFLEEQKAEIVLLQCTSRYPTPLSEVGINAMDDMVRRYHNPVRCV